MAKNAFANLPNQKICPARTFVNNWCHSQKDRVSYSIHLPGIQLTGLFCAEDVSPSHSCPSQQLISCSALFTQHLFRSHSHNFALFPSSSFQLLPVLPVLPVFSLLQSPSVFQGQILVLPVTGPCWGTHLFWSLKNTGAPKWMGSYEELIITIIPHFLDPLQSDVGVYPKIGHPTPSWASKRHVLHCNILQVFLHILHFLTNPRDSADDLACHYCSDLYWAHSATKKIFPRLAAKIGSCPHLHMSSILVRFSPNLFFVIQFDTITHFTISHSNPEQIEKQWLPLYSLGFSLAGC